MFVIFNHNRDNLIPITEGTYDCINDAFYLKNALPEEQTPELLKYLASIKDIPIKSIEVERRNHDPLDSYENLNGHILNIRKTLNQRADGLTFTILTIDIENKQ